MNTPRDLDQIFREFINALVARIATDVSAQIAAAQGVRPRLLSVEQAAVYLGRTDKAVRHLIVSGAFPAVRTDGRVMLDVQDLDKWISQNKTGME